MLCFLKLQWNYPFIQRNDCSFKMFHVNIFCSKWLLVIKNSFIMKCVVLTALGGNSTFFFAEIKTCAVDEGS